MVKDMENVNNCSYCKQVFIPTKSNQLYCSKNCYNKDYYYKNKDTRKDYAAKQHHDYYIKNREKINLQNNKWHQNNKERMNEFGRKSREKRKQEILTYYGGCFCSICGIVDIEVLTIDHIDGGGTKQRRGFRDGHAIYRWILNNNFPPGFRVLCRNCNWKEYRRMLREVV